MKKFDGILICTDLDGTLLKNDKTISEENIKAIEFFKSEGGIFTFITGRMPYFVSDIYDSINPNAPFGCINGGGLYDHIRQEYIWQSVMPTDVLELVEYADNEFPKIGIQVNTFFKAYFCKENQAMKNFRKRTKLPNYACHYTDIKEPIAKILFGSESDDELERLKEMLNAHPLAERFNFIRSEKNLYEILPKGIGKGTAITKLTQYLGTDINKTVAIGDYNNDISMFNTAKIGVAVSNACPDALKAADYITLSNEEHAIAKVIEDIDSGILTL